MFLPISLSLATALLLLFPSVVVSQDTSLRTVKAAFDKANITEAADITFDPRDLLEVAFPQASGPDVLVHAGVQLPRNQTAIPPVFGIQHTLSSRETSSLFVVAMVDLDAPTPQAPTEAQIRHFLGGNFALGHPDARGLALLSNSTPALSEFMQPTPPAGSDPHRYIFLLFQQPSNFNSQTEVTATTSVENFNISQFALDVGLGNPLGVGTMLLYVISLLQAALVSILTLRSQKLLTFARESSLRTVKVAFDNANIPEDADLIFDPTALLEVSFPQAASLPVDLIVGERLFRNQTAIPPIFGIQNSAFSSAVKETFVVAMVDLDAPTPQAPTNAQIRHFLGGNFALERPDAHGVALLTNSTPALSEFKQPTPPAGSDPHRYVFLLFEQSPGFNEQADVNTTTPISNFNISQFALDVGLGNPLGGTFMLVGPDPTTSS
ncbi:hypothetical protein EW145_g5758 [Phellinidium pouzarii]|uniref:PEBP-like protein n=1 Tax=Phellinidium pouzarii TaxID=167371 RepID=A0A4S4KZI3_9AGAM|nr:hypothetical protein EW145_g5758 [Phellinidium pouzarii]